jgi:hypothetical protein
VPSLLQCRHRGPSDFAPRPCYQYSHVSSQSRFRPMVQHHAFGVYPSR